MNSEATFYVAPDGHDGWSGKLPAPNAERTDGPFATPHRARDVMRRFKSGQRFSGPVTVMLLEGTWFLDKPLQLTGEDSGTAEQPVTWTAFPGHRPVLSGGRRITDWKPAQGSILQAVLPKVKSGDWHFRQLFYHGARQIRARWPNRDPKDPLYGGWAFVEKLETPGQGNAFRFSYSADSKPRRWSKPAQAEINIFPWYCWVNDILPVSHSDEEQGTIALGRGPHHKWMPPMSGNRFIVENVLEELDQPGEWCLDRETGTLSFWPPAVEQTVGGDPSMNI